jgi:hypothetical protein
MIKNNHTRASQLGNALRANRSWQIATFLLALPILLVHSFALPTSVDDSPVVASTPGLSAAVERSDGTYEIQDSNGGHSIIRARRKSITSGSSQLTIRNMTFLNRRSRMCWDAARKSS